MPVAVFFAPVKYGKVPDEERDMVLPGVDFSLPEDHADTGRDWLPTPVRPTRGAGGGQPDHSPLARERVSCQGPATNVARALRGGLDH